MKTIQKLQSTFIVLAFIFVAINLHAQEPFVPNGEYTRLFAGGTGTSEDPYLISTPQHLSNLRHIYGSDSYDIDTAAHYSLENDIDISGFALEKWGNTGWEPILAMQGHLDGNNHQVTGLWINWTDWRDKSMDKSLAGLFRGISGEVKNLNVVTDDARGGVRGCGRVGGLAGVIEGKTSNCHVTGNIFGYGSFFTNNAVGGLTGCASHATITDCSVHGNVGLVSLVYEGAMVAAGTVGGLVGEVIAARRGTSPVYDPVAGKYVGWEFNESYYLYTKSYITRCYTECNINTLPGSGVVGGLVATLGDGAEVSDCYTTGDLACSGINGGLFGEANGITRVTNCYASGIIGGDFSHWDSPVVGRLRLATKTLGDELGPLSQITISGCHFRQESEGINSWIDPNASNEAADQIQIKWLKEENNMDFFSGISYGAGIAETTAEMKRKSTFAGFDFVNVWAIDEGKSFPYLRGIAANVSAPPRADISDPTGTVQPEATASALKAYAAAGTVYISGLTVGEQIRLYDVGGQLLYSGRAVADAQSLPLAGKGVYIVTAGSSSVKVVQ